MVTSIRMRVTTPAFSKNLQVIVITDQGCQIVYLHAKNPNVGTFWWTLEWKMLVYLMTIRNILHIGV